LSGEKLTDFWDFQQAIELIEQGYEAMQKEITALVEVV
jgi:hypothetical protein